MSSASFLRAAARCWESAGHFDRAAERFARADAWTDAGRCWALAGRPVEAANAYARAGDLINEARQWLESPWPERARRPYRQALEKGLPLPTEVEALLGLGEIGLASNRAFDVASGSRRSSEVLRALARLAAARGRPDLAARAWDEAIVVNPVSAGEIYGDWKRVALWNRSLSWKGLAAGTAGWPRREFGDVRLELVWEEAFVGQMGYGNRALSWSTDGRRFAAVRIDEALMLFHLSGRDVQSHSIPMNARSVAFVPRSDSVLVGCADGQVVRVNPSGEQYELSELRTPTAVWSVAFSPTGDRLSISSATRPGAIVRAWSWTSQGPGDLLWEEKTQDGNKNNPYCVWSPNGRTLAWCPGPWGEGVVGNDLYLFSDSGVRRISEAHQNGVDGMAFSPDGRLMTASADGTLILRDPGSGHPMSPTWRGSPFLLTAAFHPHAGLIAAGGFKDRPSRVFLVRLSQDDPTHLETLQEVTTEVGVYSVAFSPDGEHFLLATSYRISLFRVHFT